jgi:hypothetical protein
MKMMEFNRILKLFLIMVVFLFVVRNSYSTTLDFSTNESIVESFYDVKEETISLIDQGLPLNRVFYMINDGEVYILSENYQQIQKIAKECNDISNDISDIYKSINDAQIKIDGLKELGYNTTNEKNLLNLSKNQFEIEDFDSTKNTIRQISIMLDPIIRKNANKLNDDLKTIQKIVQDNKINTPLINNTIVRVNHAKYNQDYAYIIKTISNIDTINESINFVITIDKRINELSKKQRQTTRINDLKSEILSSLNNEDFDTVALVYTEIEILFDNINNIEELIVATRNKINELFYIEDIKQINATLNRAIDKYNDENYEDSLEDIQNNYDTLIKLESQSLLFGAVSVSKIKLNLIKTIKEKPWIVIVFLIVVLFCIFVVKKILRIIFVYLYENRVKKLEKEIKVINELVKQNQREYYVKHVIDKETYDTTIFSHQEKLIQINEKIPVLKHLIEKMSKKKSNEDLGKKI